MKIETHNFERRKQARLEKLGTNNPICGICGKNNWICIEQHHVASKRQDDVMVLLCANCHLETTDSQKGHPAFDPAADPFLSSVGHFLLGLADMLKIILDKLQEFGRQLIERAKSKDGLDVQS
jgi:hypothetical protein